ncbi:MAG TPA: MBL fold metallo-hydrolase [Dehalococcoidia bacterium]|jgi:ribonuclease BN (tRNA processing enzyme)|nr:MBL fold metallo-hydrolase [Dehalococcoidia bacterium]
MTLDLTFIGTGNAFAPTRYWSSFLLDDRILFDAPPTLLAHLKKLGKNPGDIEVAFISHFHGDHFFGLPFLLLEYAELAPRTKDLTIVGPPGIAQRTRALTDLAFSNVFRKDRGYMLNFVEAGEGASGEVGGLRWRSREVPHVPGLECYAFRVESEGGKIAYSGDSMMTDALVDLADESDVFVCECSCWGENCGPHLNPKDIMTLRGTISARTKLILTHIGGGEAPQMIKDAGILIADDFEHMSFETVGATPSSRAR